MKKRVLHVLNSNEYTGAENIAVTIIRRLSSKYDFAYGSREGPINDVLKKEGIEYINLKATSPSHIRKTIDMWKPDLIHAHDYTASIMCAICSYPTPVVGHLHCYHDWLNSFNKRSFALLIAGLRLKRIIACTPIISDKYIFAGRFTGKIRALSNVIDKSRVFEMLSDIRPSSNYDIGFMGRMTEQKEPIRFIHIVNKIREKKPDVKAVMIGDGILMEDCIKEIENLGLQDSIHLKGFMDNPIPLLKNTRVFVMTSKYEGLPLSAMEAMILGIPVFATQNCGLQDFISDGGCGAVCVTDNDFKDNILKVLNDDKTYMELSQKAITRVEQLCCIEKYLGNIEQVYSDCWRKI